MIRDALLIVGMWLLAALCCLLPAAVHGWRTSRMERRDGE